VDPALTGRDPLTEPVGEYEALMAVVAGTTREHARARYEADRVESAADSRAAEKVENLLKGKKAENLAPGPFVPIEGDGNRRRDQGDGSGSSGGLL
jgi:hypothetical protein